MQAVVVMLGIALSALGLVCFFTSVARPRPEKETESGCVLLPDCDDDNFPD